MALARTTLSSAVTVNDNSIVVALATSVAAGRLIMVDQEWMQVGQAYVSGTTVPVLRGREGSAVAAHVTSAGVVHGTAADFDNPTAQTVVTQPTQRPRTLISVTGTTTLTFPAGPSDMDVILNGTTIIALTIPVPTTDMDGAVLNIMANGAAAHTLTFTGGLGGAGTSYDVITVNATAPTSFTFRACNALWLATCGPAMGGTVTNIIGSVA